jgi:hypothetical protein
MKRRFANSFEFDPSKPLVVPYGRYPHKATGAVQLVDHATALAWAENVAAAKAAGAPGVPVYVGHPDVPELAAKFPDKAAKGWIVSVGYVRTGDTECSLSVEWCDAPKPGAFIYFSPYMAGDDAAGGEVHIDELKSVGLTNRPNVTRFRLPNEAADEDTQPERTIMKKLLTQLGLPETATEDEASAKLQELIDARTAADRKVEELTATASTANEACATAKKEMANEREARIGLLLDCAMQEGRVTPATKPVWEGRLRKDFANEHAALGKEKPALKTRTELPNEAGDASPSGVLARYESMPEGGKKDAFFRDHVEKINDARNAAQA